MAIHALLSRAYKLRQTTLMLWPKRAGSHQLPKGRQPPLLVCVRLASAQSAPSSRLLSVLASVRLSLAQQLLGNQQLPHKVKHMPVRQWPPAKSQQQLLLLLLGNKAVAAQQLPRRYSWELQFALLQRLQRLLSAPCIIWIWLPSWAAPCFVQKSTLPSPVCKPSFSSTRSLPTAEQSRRQRLQARLFAQRHCLRLPAMLQPPGPA